jgi:hypothetical protein
MDKLRNNRVAIQIDEATDCSGVAHVIAYVRYVENKTPGRYDFLQTYKK